MPALRLRMTCLGFILLPLLALAGCATLRPARASHPDPLYAAAAHYRTGDDRTTLTTIEARARAAQQRPAVELAFVALAMDRHATLDARRWACAQLQVYGTARSTPALLQLLRERDLFVPALAALEKIPDTNPDQPINAALRERVPHTDDLWRIALMNALARRGDPDAVPVFMRQLTSGDPFVVQAAAEGLGQMGTVDAARALRAALDLPARPLPSRLQRSRGAHHLAGPLMRRRLLAENMVRCADHLQSHDAATALKIYQGTFRMFSAEFVGGPETTATLRVQPVRVAALRGWARLDPATAAPVLLRVLMHDGATTSAVRARRAALQIAGELPNNVMTPPLTTLLPLAPTARQADLITLLARRNDPAAAAAVRAALARALEQKDEATALIAMATLQQWPTPANAQALLRVAATQNGKPREAARAALRAMPAAPATADFLLATARQVDTPAEASEALLALGALPGAATRAAAYAAATTTQTELRRTAAIVLSQTAGAPDAPRLLNLYIAAPAAQRGWWEKPLLAATRAVEPATARAAGLLNALQTNGDDQPLTNDLLRLLGKLGDPAAIAPLQTAALHGPLAQRETATRALAECGLPEAQPALLQLARKARPPRLQSLALQGYLDQLEAQRAATTATLLLERLQATAHLPAVSAEAKLRLLGLAGQVPAPGTIDFIQTFLSDRAASATAAVALAQQAVLFSGVQPSQAQRALDAIPAALAQASGVTPAYAAARATLRRQQDYIVNWEIAGPFVRIGQSLAHLIDTPCPVEADPPAAEWRPLPGSGSGINILDGFTPGNPAAVACVRAAVWSPTAQRARLLLGSDDAIAAWVNGRHIGEFCAEHPVTPDQYTLEVELTPGWNRLMLKIANAGGGWGFCARLRPLKGDASLPGLKFRPTW
jgi:HEAT repeat protein